MPYRFFILLFGFIFALSSLGKKGEDESLQNLDAVGICNSSQFDYLWTDGDRDKKKILRSHSKHWWAIVKHCATAHVPNEILKHNGVIVGDPHTLNFSSVFTGGDPLFDYALVDIDDSGYGPFIMDISRNLSVAKAALRKKHQGELNLQQAIDAYLQGLNCSLQGGSFCTYSVPQLVTESLARSEAKFWKAIEKYVGKRIKTIGEKGQEPQQWIIDTKKIEAHRFDDLEGDLKVTMPIDWRELQSTITDQGWQILDAVVRWKEGSGGSEGIPRIVALVLDDKNRKLVFEFKQVPAADEVGTAQYMEQPSPEDRLMAVTQIYWPQSVQDSPYYQIVSTSSGRNYYFNLRQPSHPKHEDSPKKTGEAKTYVELVKYNGFVMGKAQGEQEGAQAYFDAISKDKDSIVRLVTRVIEIYNQWVIEGTIQTIEQ